MKYLLLPCFLLFVLISGKANTGTPLIQFEWSELASIPPAVGASVQPGMAGAFVGLHNDALIIAGGANFPNGPAWEGGSKQFHRDIYVLEKDDIGNVEWFGDKQFSLREKVAYGLTVPTPEGLLCIGGTDGTDFQDAVFLLKWDAQKKEIEIDNLPPLPTPIAYMSGGKIGNKIYVAASLDMDGSKFFWVLDLTNIKSGWKALPVWEGSPRSHAVGVVQNNGETDCFFLIKGRFKGKNTTSTLLSDAWEYNPVSGEWKEMDTKSEVPVNLSAGTGVAVGANHILLLGGAEGQLLNRLEQFAYDINTTSDVSTLEKLKFERDAILKTHPGFSKNIWAYHTITQSWTKIGEFVYYKVNPAELSPALEKTDAVFPWYIVNSLPEGVSGLLIAAVFAASMSSLDSSMNSVSTVITTDFFRRLRPLNSEKAYLKLARILTIIIGIFGTGLALMMASWGISSLWDQFKPVASPSEKETLALKKELDAFGFFDYCSKLETAMSF